MDAFSKAGYGVGEIGWGRRAAVLAVDFQSAFTSPDFPMGGGDHIAAAVRCAAEVIAAARAADVLVVHTAVAWSNPREFGRWKVPALLDIKPGSAGAQTDPLLWDPSDTYLLKRYPSAFFGTDLSSILQRNDVDTVLVMGATTSGCVRATVIDSFSHGFRTRVVQDACGDQDAEAHAANLRDVGRRYADIIDARTAIQHLVEISQQAAAAS
jgi:maleamate amidohydrolase